MPYPIDDIRAAWRALLRVTSAMRWRLALAIFLAGLTVWLEAVAPARPLPVFLGCVAVSALLCGVRPGACVAVGSAAAIWWFSLRVPGELQSCPASCGSQLLAFGVASLALLACAAALRRGGAATD